MIEFRIAYIKCDQALHSNCISIFPKMFLLNLLWILVIRFLIFFLVKFIWLGRLRHRETWIKFDQDFKKHYISQFNQLWKNQKHFSGCKIYIILENLTLCSTHIILFRFELKFCLCNWSKWNSLFSNIF